MTDPRLSPYLTPDEIDSLRNSFLSPGTSNSRMRWTPSRELKAAGVTILAGSDAPNPGTAHGASIHRELELLVKAGLTPLQALAAATSAPGQGLRL